MKFLFITLGLCTAMPCIAQIKVHVDAKACYKEALGSKEDIYLHNQDTLTVYPTSDRYYYSANLNGKTIYIKYWYLEELADRIDAEDKIVHKKASQEANAKRINRLVAKYGATIGKVIASGKVKIGMTKNMAVEAWGKPDDIYTTTSYNYTHEQWVYGNRSYLYFTNGKLTTIQN